MARTGLVWLRLPAKYNGTSIYLSELNKLITYTPIINQNLINSEIEKLETNIKTAKLTATTFKHKQKNSNLSSHIKKLLINKNKAKKQYFTTLSPNDKNKLNNLNNKLQNAIDIHVNQTGNNKIDKFNDTKEPTWKFIKSLKNSKSQNAPLKNGDKTKINKTLCF